MVLKLRDGTELRVRVNEPEAPAPEYADPFSGHELIDPFPRSRAYYFQADPLSMFFGGAMLLLEHELTSAIDDLLEVEREQAALRRERAHRRAHRHDDPCCARERSSAIHFTFP